MYLTIEILRIIVPWIFILGIVYFIVTKFIANENKKQWHTEKIAKQKILLPVRMQAYERIILFLERISINHLILRINHSGITSAQLHNELIASTREEFNHNLSQQVYISFQGWELVKAAIEENIMLINTVSNKINRESQSFELAGKLLEEAAARREDPVVRALDFLKKEAGNLL